MRHVHKQTHPQISRKWVTYIVSFPINIPLILIHLHKLRNTTAFRHCLDIKPICLHHSTVVCLVCFVEFGGIIDWKGETVSGKMAFACFFA